jgi:hypothetical protein
MPMHAPSRLDPTPEPVRFASPPTPSSRAADEHARQRQRVIESLLRSAHTDEPTRRRWA